LKKVKVKLLLRVPFESCWQLPVPFSDFIVSLCIISGQLLKCVVVLLRTLLWILDFFFVAYWISLSELPVVSALLGASKWIIYVFREVPYVVGVFLCRGILGSSRSVCICNILYAFKFGWYPRFVDTVRYKIHSLMHLTRMKC
jgi:hypothetical protein